MIDKFPKILQFRNVVENVLFRAENNGGKTKLSFTGTVKLHGTNAAVGLSDGNVSAWRRKGQVDIANDNYGFASFVKNNEASFKNLLNEDWKIFGEWAGKKINSGAAICKIERAFFVFAVHDGKRWLSHEEFDHLKDPDARIFNVCDYGVLKMEIDFTNPEEHSELLFELTTDVDRLCPVASTFGVEGPGEGIVWTADDDEYQDDRYWFKVKGETHKVTSTKRTKQKVETSPELAKSVEEFIEWTVTENRLKQGLENIDKIDRPYTGQFLQWVVNDILTEEADRLAASGLQKSDVSKKISSKAREWFFERI